jgi:hypothetical protein
MAISPKPVSGPRDEARKGARISFALPTIPPLTDRVSK